MEATILNLQENSTTTPVEVIAAFTRIYTPLQAKNQLWELFYLAVKGGLEDPTSRIIPEEAALLIDQLISLVTAVSIIHQDGRALQTIEQEAEHD